MDGHNYFMNSFRFRRNKKKHNSFICESTGCREVDMQQNKYNFPGSDQTLGIQTY